MTSPTLLAAELRHGRKPALDRIRRAFRRSTTFTEAAAHLGIGVTTLRNWAQRSYPHHIPAVADMADEAGFVRSPGRPRKVNGS